MKEIKLNFSIAEANLILKALGNLPYVQVAGLIEKIQAQATVQVSEVNGNHNAELKSDVTVSNF